MLKLHFQTQNTKAYSMATDSWKPGRSHV